MNRIYNVEAFFTLSHKAIPRTEEVSSTKAKQIMGNKNAEILNFVLIGQIGKYYHTNTENKVKKSEITLAEILHYAHVQMERASAYIPNKWILVECSDEIRNRALYEKEGFSYFKKDLELHQYIKVIKSKL